MSYLILLISGFSSLYYEFIALKYAEIHLGVSIFAVSSVLLTFLTGILGGNMLSRRFLTKNSDKQLILKLIILELLIIPAALTTPWLIKITSQLYLANIPFQWPVSTRLLLKALFFLPAFLPLSVLAGIRFPVCLKAFNPDNRIGTLYGFSCLGSAAGALAGGFFMFEYVDLYTSLVACVCAAATLNIILLTVYYKTRFNHKKKQATQPVDTASLLALMKKNTGTVALFFLLGMITIGMEVLWVRCLMHHFPNNRYVFSTITVTLLFSLFAGSVSNHFFKAEKKTVLHTCLMLAISLQLCLGAQEYFNFFKYFSGVNTLPWFIFKSALITMLIVGLPGFIMGLLFPMLFNHALKSKVATNRQLTFLSVTANSAGAISGAFIFGLILMNLAGYKWLITGVNLLIMITAILFLLKNKPGKKVIFYAAALAVFAVSTFSFFQEKGLDNYYLVAKLNGADADVRIYEEKIFDAPNRVLTLNQAFLSGGSGYIAERKQLKQGLLPILLAPAKNNALVISLATGITASAFTEAGVKDIDCIELLPSSTKLSSYFSKENNDVVKHKNFNLFIGDGRLFIKGSRKKYDIILSDNYQYSSAATPIMYSLETFSDISKIMSDNGIFIQWLPIKQIPPEHLSIIINTFHKIFPDGLIYFNDISRSAPLVALLAYKNKITAYPQIIANYQNIKSVADKSLINNNIVSAYYIGTVAEYCQLFKENEVNSYEHPVLEKYFHGNNFEQQNLDNFNSLYRKSRQNHLIPPQEISANSLRRVLFQEVAPVMELQKNMQYGQALRQLDNLLQSLKLNNQSLNSFFPEISFLKGELCLNLAVQAFRQGNAEYAWGYLNATEASIFRSSLFYRLKGILTGVNGNLDGAMNLFNQALLLEPKNQWVYESMALTYFHYQQTEKALECLKKALNTPYPDQAILRTALTIYMRLDRYEDFLQLLKKYIILPDVDKAALKVFLKYLEEKKNSIMIKEVKALL